MKFPVVRGENLQGRTFTLPADFEKERNIVIIAFQREQQYDVDTWTPLMKRLTAEHTDLAVYELPTISALNPLFQWYINRGMRAGIPDPGTRHATITLYLDKQPFRQALDLPDEERIYLLMVTGTGDVVWRTEGRWTQEKEQQLQAFLSQAVVK